MRRATAATCSRVLEGLLAAQSLTTGSPLDSDFPEDENTIAFNSAAAVAVLDGAGGALVRQNTFVDNIGLPIDLGNDGPNRQRPGRRRPAPPASSTRPNSRARVA